MELQNLREWKMNCLWVHFLEKKNPLVFFSWRSSQVPETSHGCQVAGLCWLIAGLRQCLFPGELGGRMQWKKHTQSSVSSCLCTSQCPAFHKMWTSSDNSWNWGFMNTNHRACKLSLNNTSCGRACWLTCTHPGLQGWSVPFALVSLMAKRVGYAWGKKRASFLELW